MFHRQLSHQNLLVNKSEGYVLVVVLLVIFMGVLLIGLSTALTITNSKQHTMGESRKKIQYALDSAIENAILISLRKPSYQGEYFSIDDILVDVQIASGSPTIIFAVATESGQVHQSSVVLERINGKLEIQSWTHY